MKPQGYQSYQQIQTGTSQADAMRQAMMNSLGLKSISGSAMDGSSKINQPAKINQTTNNNTFEGSQSNSSTTVNAPLEMPAWQMPQMPTLPQQQSYMPQQEQQKPEKQYSSASGNASQTNITHYGQNKVWNTAVDPITGRPLGQSAGYMPGLVNLSQYRI